MRFLLILISAFNLFVACTNPLEEAAKRVVEERGEEVTEYYGEVLDSIFSQIGKATESADESWKGETELLIDSLMLEFGLNNFVGTTNDDANLTAAIQEIEEELLSGMGLKVDLDSLKMRNDSIMSLVIATGLPGSRVKVANMETMFVDSLIGSDTLFLSRLSLTQNYLIQIDNEGYPSKAVLIDCSGSMDLDPVMIEVFPSMTPLSDYKELTPNNPFNYPVALIKADLEGKLNYDMDYIAARSAIIETFLKEPE